MKYILIVSLLLMGCEQSKEQQIKTAIKTYLNQNLDDISSYEPVVFGKIDTLNIINGYIINYTNYNNPYQIVHNKNGNLGFYDSVNETVLVYNENDFDIFLIKNNIGIFDHKYYKFYTANFKANKYEKKMISISNLEHNYKPIKYSKVDSIQLQVFHSFRLKSNNSNKRIFKYYFRLNNKLEVLDKSDKPFSEIDYSEIYFDNLNSDTAAYAK